jgi:hypothetical protein
MKLKTKREGVKYQVASGRASALAVSRGLPEEETGRKMAGIN